MFEVLDGGVQTTVQDGGRPGYLAAGYPPAGAQDYYALSIANLLVGNQLTPPPLSAAPPGHAGLEMLIKGASLRFEADAVFVLAGADMGGTLDGEPVARYRPVRAPSGSVLQLGLVQSGARGYLAIAGGIA
ncbi:MAG: allophanate hydrolase, partial [Gammaproteobacteria bacterium]|nr:allophanate hydrolase [Gammaproteobacteria bacterium]